MSLLLRRRPLVPQLHPERLQIYLNALTERRDGAGEILEVGCYKGGTVVRACQHLRRLGEPRPYCAIDTFTGFVPDQFAEDECIGIPPRLRDGFSDNSKRLVERTMHYYGLDEVRVIQADICEMAEEEIPSQISVCLMDVDLAVPIEVGLRKVWPRMVPGGVIFVDDCDDDKFWRGARVGYQRFCAASGMKDRYEAGFGVLRA